MNTLKYLLLGSLLLVNNAASQISSFSPSKVLANSPFSLKLSNTQMEYSCASEYPLLEFQVEGTIITLRYIHEVNPLIDCIEIEDPLMTFEPIFSHSGLPAGSYTVFANQSFSCLNEIPSCMIPEYLEEVGILSILDSNDYSQNFWYFEDVNPSPADPFGLQLLNPVLGNCNDYFQIMNTVSQFGYIHLEFAIHRHDPELTCTVDIHPHGPEFALEGLTEGEYDVYYTAWPSCAVCPPGGENCAICQIFVSPTYAGQLTVGTPSATLSKSRPAFEPHIKRFSDRLEIQSVDFPLWATAALTGIDGRTHEIELTLQSGRTYTSQVLDLSPGLYILSLTNQRGEVQSRKIAW